MLKVLFVCSGNRCRSAVAEASLRYLASDLPIETGSAGTLDIPSQSPPRETIDAAERLGLDISGHRSRRLTNELVSSADLILGFERDHAAVAVVEYGGRVASTFLLAEFVRLLDKQDLPDSDDWESGARQAIKRADEHRRSGPMFVPEDSVPDPIGKPFEVHQRVAESVHRLCTFLLKHLSTG